MQKPAQIQFPPQAVETARTLYRAVGDLEYFTEHIFSLSTDIFKDGRFTAGEHPRSVARWMQANRKTMRVSAKDHFKSAALYAHFMREILMHPDDDLEAHYFSYEEGMAGYHVGKIKRAIACNPFFAELRDIKSNAETVAKYTWDGKHVITIEPHGLLAFKRGIHCPLVYVDDPLQDPAQKLVLTTVRRINEIMKTQVLDMTWDQLHIVGTAQTNEDFYFDKAMQAGFGFLRQPAVISDAERVALWPEWMDYDELQRRRLQRGDKVFQQEYLVVPSYAADSFFSRDRVLSIVNPSLKSAFVGAARDPGTNDVVAGYDIGKKTHPSHFAVFEKQGAKRIQVHQMFMDGWDYGDQIEYVKQAIENFGIDYVWYDSTRGELDALKERGDIPAEMVPVPFTLKTKHAIATLFDRAVTAKEIEIIDDPRQIEQLLAVTNDLQAVEGPGGHGDSFWSIALSFMGEVAGGPMMTEI